MDLTFPTLRADFLLPSSSCYDQQEYPEEALPLENDILDPFSEHIYGDASLKLDNLMAYLDGRNPDGNLNDWYPSAAEAAQSTSLYVRRDSSSPSSCSSSSQLVDYPPTSQSHLADRSASFTTPGGSTTAFVADILPMRATKRKRGEDATNVDDKDGGNVKRPKTRRTFRDPSEAVISPAAPTLIVVDSSPSSSGDISSTPSPHHLSQPRSHLDESLPPVGTRNAIRFAAPMVPEHFVAGRSQRCPRSDEDNATDTDGKPRKCRQARDAHDCDISKKRICQMSGARFDALVKGLPTQRGFAGYYNCEVDAIIRRMRKPVGSMFSCRISGCSAEFETTQTNVKDHLNNAHVADNTGLCCHWQHAGRKCKKTFKNTEEWKKHIFQCHIKTHILICPGDCGTSWPVTDNFAAKRHMIKCLCGTLRRGRQ